MDNAVGHIVVAHNLELGSLFQKPAQLDRIRVKAQILRRAHEDTLLPDDIVRVISQIGLGDVAVFERVQIRQVIRHAVFFAGVFRRIRHLAAAHGSSGRLQIFIEIAHARAVGAEICLFITARLLRLGRLLLRFFLPAGNHTDKQNQRHQHQNRKQNQPGVLPEELHLLLLLATPGFARLWISVGLPILFRLRLHASSLPSCMESLYINFSEISTIFVRFLKECPVFPSFLVFSLHFTAPAFTFSGSFHHFRAKASAFEIVM